MNASIYGIVVLSLVLAFLSFLATAVYRTIALKINLIDYPNERSSHKLPTPSGAGLVFVCLTIGCIYLVISPTNGDWAKLSLLLTFAAVALLGTIDDGFDLPILFRFSLQILFVFGVVAAIIGMSDGSDVLNRSWFEKSIQVMSISVCMLWFLNLYNFMDGIDGLACTEAIFIALASGLFLYGGGSLELAFWMLILVATLFGFLFWNLPPAKVFMGDAGSSFLGFYFATISLMSITSGHLSLYFWMILCAIFVTDSTFTLCHRALRGENIFKAHRTHAYQHASVIFGEHARVVKICLMINVFWLFPLASASYFLPSIALYCTLIAYSPLVYITFRLNAGSSIVHTSGS